MAVGGIPVWTGVPRGHEGISGNGYGRGMARGDGEGQAASLHQPAGRTGRPRRTDDTGGGRRPFRRIGVLLDPVDGGCPHRHRAPAGVRVGHHQRPAAEQDRPEGPGAHEPVECGDRARRERRGRPRGAGAASALRKSPGQRVGHGGGRAGSHRGDRAVVRRRGTGRPGRVPAGRQQPRPPPAHGGRRTRRRATLVLRRLPGSLPCRPAGPGAGLRRQRPSRCVPQAAQPAAGAALGAVRPGVHHGADRGRDPHHRQARG